VRVIAGPEDGAMDRELLALRRELAQHEGGRGKRYEPELRARLITWLARRRKAGMSLAAVASELSLPMNTVARWASAAKQSTALVPVTVVEEPVASPSTIRVVSPEGFIVEGLTLQEIAVLLRALR
jgi:hypothetical protein